MHRHFVNKTSKIAQKPVIWLIKGYRIILSPLLGNQCRFYPTCSRYAEAAIQEYGVIKGSMLSIFRILKCNPFHPGGHDPINPK